MTTFTSWDAELYHHGIKGQKWGVRRFQNADGTLTAAGKQRYFNDDGTLNRRGRKEYSRQYKTAAKLIERANLSKQAENYQKYQKRAKTSAKVAAGLGIGAASAVGLGQFAGAKALAKGLKRSEDWRGAARFFREEAGHQTNLYRHPELYDSTSANVRSLMGSANNADIKAALWKQTAASDQKRHVSTGAKVALGLGAGAAVAVGVTAYNRHKASAARTLLSDAGHAKAVAEAREYVARMSNAFGDVSVADLKKKVG